MMHTKEQFEEIIKALEYTLEVAEMLYANQKYLIEMARGSPKTQEEVFAKAVFVGEDLKLVKELVVKVREEI